MSDVFVYHISSHNIHDCPEIRDNVNEFSEEEDYDIHEGSTEGV